VQQENARLKPQEKQLSRKGVVAPGARAFDKEVATSGGTSEESCKVELLL